ncbi:hypothetical protein DDE82_004240 [Stemphylium lycopersici]|uniref:Uncharacterized protein n=1 Tax=Stemphylium lycopersici TaxID=183478 RepID=A0A364N569_STELY|nr:hypothetical protein TW65_07705 [Stemphylium lycopersici]RAR04988.1 hypothetical protein DDE82_004240 [Stemphylium lycopersici]RAR12231.1 hypothetical protein DDE83_004237 [Stemphylium lycopersici]
MSDTFTLPLAQLCVIYLLYTTALFTAILKSSGFGVESFIYPRRTKILSAIIQTISKSSKADIDITTPELATPQKSSYPKCRIRSARKKCSVVPGVGEAPMAGPGCSIM